MDGHHVVDHAFLPQVGRLRNLTPARRYQSSFANARANRRIREGMP